MRTDSFDLPYAPFISAFVGIGRVFFVAAVLAVFSYGVLAMINQWPPFSGSRYRVAEQGPGVSGVVGGGISLQVEGLSVKYPGEDGVLYFAQSKLEKERVVIDVTRTLVKEDGSKGGSTNWRVQCERSR